MDIRDIVYHGVRDQIRRVLGQMTEDEIDKGLTAIEDGSSNWSHCFFARAYPDAGLDGAYPERKLMQILHLDTPIPIRIVYRTFDNAGVTMNRKQLGDFISAIRDESRPQEVLAVIRGIDYKGAEEASIEAACA